MFCYGRPLQNDGESPGLHPRHRHEGDPGLPDPGIRRQLLVPEHQELHRFCGGIPPGRHLDRSCGNVKPAGAPRKAKKPERKRAPESELSGADGGEEGIRTLARLFAGYRISSFTNKSNISGFFCRIQVNTSPRKPRKIKGFSR